MIVLPIHNAGKFEEVLKPYRPDSFTHTAWETMFAHYSEMSDDNGEDIKVDKEDLSEWCEYDSLNEAADDLGYDPAEYESGGALLRAMRDSMTVYVLTNGKVLVYD